MKNIQVVEIRPEIKNGWAVKADSKQFGKDAVMFEGSYEDCWKYLKSFGCNKVRAWVYGKRGNTEMQGVNVIFDKATNKFNFPGFFMTGDLEKLDKLVAC